MTQENEPLLNPRESLALIMEIITLTRENLKQHSFIFLLWGWLLAVASIARFILESFTDVLYYFLPFPILAAVGAVVTILHYRPARKQQPETHLNDFIKKLWLVLSVGLIVCVFTSVYQGNVPFTYTMILAGIGTLLTGLVMKFNPLLFGGIWFLVSSVYSVFLPDEYKVLVHGMAIIIGFLIPGYLLKNAKP